MLEGSEYFLELQIGVFELVQAEVESGEVLLRGDVFSHRYRKDVVLQSGFGGVSFCAICAKRRQGEYAGAAEKSGSF